MYSDFHQFSFLGMSSSDFHLLKQDLSQIKFITSSPPNLESPSRSPSQLQNQEEGSENLTKTSLNQSEVAATATAAVGDDNDDGFRTPTSLDHKIPALTKCPPPPPPKKISQSRKRKASLKVRQNLELDLSEEVESMFPAALQENIGRKIKKARHD